VHLFRGSTKACFVTKVSLRHYSTLQPYHRLTKRKRPSREDLIFTIIRRKDLEHHSDLSVDYDTWSKSILSTLVIRDDWIVSMTWLRIRINSNSHKTRG